jgi:sorting nexin-8
MPGLSKDTVDALRKKVESRKIKVESLRSAQKPGWEFEADKLAACTFTSSLPLQRLRLTNSKRGRQHDNQ